MKSRLDDDEAPKIAVKSIDALASTGNYSSRSRALFTTLPWLSPSPHGYVTEISTLGRNSQQTFITLWMTLPLSAAISAASPAFPSSMFT